MRVLFEKVVGLLKTRIMGQQQSRPVNKADTYKADKESKSGTSS